MLRYSPGLAILCLLVSFLSVQAGESAMFQANLNHTGVYSTKAAAQFTGIKWKFVTNGPVRSSPTLFDGVVYFGSSDQFCYAVQSQTGRQVWKFQAGGAVHSAPACTTTDVYFTDSKGTLYDLSRADGKLKWKLETANHPYLGGWDYILSSPIVTNTLVYFGSGDGYLYAVEKTSGKQKWRFQTGEVIRSTPAVADGLLYIGGFDGKLSALDAETGQVRWGFKTVGNQFFPKGEIQGSPAIVDGIVCFGSRDYHLYALDAKTGKELWKVLHENSWVITTPVIHNGIVYAGSSDGKFVQAIDLKTGVEKWRAATTSNVLASPALAEDVVYFSQMDGVFLALDAATGKEKWKFTATDPIFSSPVVADSVVYVGCDDGGLYALSGEPADTFQPAVWKAVFWDEKVVYHWFEHHVPVRDHFVKAGYTQIDSIGLYRFMNRRIKDKTPSVIVFAMDCVPGFLASEISEKALLRQYLNAGGKIVWLGEPPLAVIKDENTGLPYNFNPERTTKVLGFNDKDADSGFYAMRATPEGKKWGMPDSWVGSWPIDPKEVTTILGTDEFGRPMAWVKNYGGPEGTGFVRLWGRQRAIDNLGAIQAIAEYGLR